MEFECRGWLSQEKKGWGENIAFLQVCDRMLNGEILSAYSSLYWQLLYLGMV